MSETTSTRLPKLSRRRFCALGTVAGCCLGVTPLLALRDVPSPAADPEGKRRADLGNGTYLNPIIAGDHPDAGAIRVGSDYYLTHSTFSYTPGLLIWHSRDLVNWQIAGAALDKYYGDVWAPYLCEHRGLYYIYFPYNGHLYVVHAESPVGPWSEVTSLNLRGFDPAHIATPDGRRFLHFAGGRMVELSADGLSVQSAPRTVFQPWPIPKSWRIECLCLEAPKLIFRNGYYYLNVAQGGTSGPPTSHMVVSARSRNVDGPWEYSPYNPIVHTRSREEKWWSTGHGRLVDALDGSWWLTLHGYENGYRTLGRQTLLLPVEWTHDNWFRVPPGIFAGKPIRKPRGSRVAPLPRLSDDFRAPELARDWQFWKGYDRSRFQTGDGRLVLQAQGASLADSSPVTCIAGDHAYTIEADVEVEPGCEAGLLLFYDERHSCGLRIGPGGVGLHRPGDLRVPATRATLRVVNDRQEADFYFKLPQGEWTRVRQSLDVSCYNQNAFGGFLDLRPALYTCGFGRAIVRSFRYAARLPR